MIAIVGHGPSLKGAGLGSQIDKADKVVRLKGSQTVWGTEDFGSRTDALCASTEVMGLFLKADANEYWAYPKNGAFDHEHAMRVLVKLERPVMIPLLHCSYWNTRFRLMGATHPNVSTGMAAILIAILRWKPKKITLYGFDTMIDPSKVFDRHPEIPRTGVGVINHDWQKEHDLLTVLSNVYKVEFASHNQLLPIGIREVR